MTSGSIEVIKIVAKGDTIHYVIKYNSSIKLLKKQVVDAWVKYHNATTLGFTPEGLPESILAIPITLYLLPVTYFYNVELIVPFMDKTLYENLEGIYAAYSKIYGPFKPEWRGTLIAKRIEENMPQRSKYEKIVFFSGGVDAVHAGIDNPGSNSVLVSVPSIESMLKGKNKRNAGEDFYHAKTWLIKEFSAIVKSDWLLVTNNFQADVFNDSEIKEYLTGILGLNSTAFRFDGWFGIRYLGNLCSVAPFAFATGVQDMILGSSFEQLENDLNVNLDGSNPELGDAIRFAGTIFSEQDGLYTRRSKKMEDIVEWCNKENKKVKIWTCFDDSREQCGKCLKCIRTQLNILCAGENPKYWGFDNFDQETFSRLVYTYSYRETNSCFVWDIVDSIDNSRTYPYCNDMLHWLKGVGYKDYFHKANETWKRKQHIQKRLRIFKIHRYPHYIFVLCKRILCRKK